MKDTHKALKSQGCVHVFKYFSPDLNPFANISFIILAILQKQKKYISLVGEPPQQFQFSNGKYNTPLHYIYTINWFTPLQSATTLKSSTSLQSTATPKCSPLLISANTKVLYFASWLQSTLQLQSLAPLRYTTLFQFPEVCLLPQDLHSPTATLQSTILSSP